MTNRVEKDLIIANKLGLHARAATQLAKLAFQFDGSITLHQGDKKAEATSVLGLMMLESSQGKTVKVVCEGPDAQHAMDAIEALVLAKFNESD
jgi:phosphocarrier protein NPr